MSILPKIQALLRAMDDDALAALANRGLLRRAKKDLETLRPEILEATETYVRLRVDDCEVTVPEVPAEARSTSPAAGIDRHVLAAFLWLKNRTEAEHVARSPGPADETAPCVVDGVRPESLDDAALVAWAGKALFSKTVKRLDGNCRCLIESENPLVIRLPERNILCRWIDGGTPETMIVRGPGKNPTEDGLLALLLYQVEKGVRPLAPQDAAALETSDGAPRTRLEVLSSLGAVLREMLLPGLTRLSEATRQRLQTLAVSAHGVDLPRLEGAIQALADEIQLQVSRNAQGSTTRILAQTVRLDALRRALENHLRGHEISPGLTPLSDLVGEHRSRYVPVGDIELIGMGARQWKTKSGYLGLTVYFWDASAKHWATWSQSRPVTTPHFHPASHFQAEGPWDGCPSPAFASRNMLKLSDAYRNSNGRLSVRKATRAVPLPIDDTDAMILPRPITDWDGIHERAKRLFHAGLAKHDERQEIVFLKAGPWNAAVFDPAEQTLYRTIEDVKGRPLPLVLSYETDFGGAEAIRLLEKYDPRDNRGVLGLIRLHRGQIAVEPVSLFDAAGIRSLTLDGKKRATPTVRGPGASDAGNVHAEEQNAGEVDDVGDDAMSSCDGPIAFLLDRTQAELERIAEAGLGGRLSNADDSQLERCARDLKEIGLEIVAQALERFLAVLRTNRRSSRDDEPPANDPASPFLRACHVVQVALRTIPSAGPGP